MQPVIIYRPALPFFSRSLLLPLLHREMLELPETHVSAIHFVPSAFRSTQARGVWEGRISQGLTKEGEEERKENDRVRTIIGQSFGTQPNVLA